MSDFARLAALERIADGMEKIAPETSQMEESIARIVATAVAPLEARLVAQAELLNGIQDALDHIVHAVGDPEISAECPRCGGSELVSAGESDAGPVVVCPCGANVVDGKVIGG